jgi:hypothetical protein
LTSQVVAAIYCDFGTSADDGTAETLMDGCSGKDEICAATRHMMIKMIRIR